MKTLKVVISLEVNSDPSDEETLKQDIEAAFMEAISYDQLDYSILDDEEDDDF